MERSKMFIIFAASFAFSHVLAGIIPQDVENDVSIYGFAKCGLDVNPLNCAKSKAGRVLDNWDEELELQMKKWGEAADLEVSRSRQLTELEERPSLAAQKLQMALNELLSLLQNSLYSRSMARKKDHDSSGGGIDSITITANQDEGGHKKSKKKKNKNKKPVSLHIHQDQKKQQDDKGLETGAAVAVEHRGQHLREGESVLDEIELAGPAKPRFKREGDEDRDVGDGRGKKKKKKKAILKLLLLGAILKAKIGLFLQILSAHLQVKFFAIALAGLALNIARFWLDLKKGHAPQKVIYYEHAQHQHHYEHDDDSGWGGYWSRSIDDAKPKVGEQRKSDEYVEAAPSGDDIAYGGWARSS